MARTTPSPFVTRHAEGLLYLATALLTAMITVISLQLWKANLGVPFAYGGDAAAVGAHFKTVLQEGWYEHQPRLGAPAGQFYNDFPTADNLHLIAAKLIGLFTSEWAVAMNVYFLIGFVLTSLSAVWFLRVCGISRLLTLALAVTFAIAPYHFFRGEAHLWLASYYGVPLVLGLLVLIFQRKPLWSRGPSQNPVLAWLWSPALRTAVWIALLATSSSYYAIFFLVLLAFTGIVVLIRDRSWGAFLGAVSAGILTVVVMLANMLPDLIFSWENGTNPGGLQRSRAETEVYALKLTQLILPWPGHRIGVLKQLRASYDAVYGPGEQPALGAIAAVGFLAAFVVICLVLVTRWRGSSPQTTRSLSLVTALSSLVLVAFVFSTVGGISTVISFLTSSLRGWNRMSIVIALLSLAIVGLLLDLAMRYLASRFSWKSTLWRGVAVVACVAIVSVAFVDQTPADAAATYSRDAQRFADDNAYFGAIEEGLPAKAMVLMLPYIPFPENSAPNGALASDQLIPYLHTSELRWSNGGIKGRPAADWPGQLANYPQNDVALLGAVAGASGVLIDRAALADRGASLEAALTSATGTPPLVSPTGEYAFYDVRALTEGKDEPAIRALLTNPVTPYGSPGFVDVLDPSKKPAWGSLINQNSFTLANPTESPISVTLSFDVSATDGLSSTTITLPGQAAQTIQPVDGVASFSSTFEVAPGHSLVSVTALDGAGQPLPKFLLTNVSVIQKPVADFLSEKAPR
jgi:hypothetical protein